jgi:carboxyl-terminal processing protease
VRRTSTGETEHGLALARLFLAPGVTLAIRERSGGTREPILATAGDGAIKLPALVLLDVGTTGAAELFASAVSGNKRADLVGEHTIGRAAMQRLIKLPDSSGLWLSTMRYLTPLGMPLHEKGLEPTVAVQEPDVEFGQAPPPGDPVLDKAIERLSLKQAA